MGGGKKAMGVGRMNAECRMLGGDERETCLDKEQSPSAGEEYVSEYVLTRSTVGLLEETAVRQGGWRGVVSACASWEDPSTIL